MNIIENLCRVADAARAYFAEYGNCGTPLQQRAADELTQALRAVGIEPHQRDIPQRVRFESFNFAGIAAQLRAAASADVWYDAQGHEDWDALTSIEAAQLAMTDAASILENVTATRYDVERAQGDWDSPEQAITWAQSQTDPLAAALEIVRHNIGASEFGFAAECVGEMQNLDI